MDFSLIPDTGPPRCIRMVEPHELPDHRTLFLLDRVTNVLHINNHLYVQLENTKQHLLLRTQVITG